MCSQLILVREVPEKVQDINLASNETWTLFFNNQNIFNNMKEEILLFVGDYKDSSSIPSLKEKVIEYLGRRMIQDDCLESPVLKLSQSLNAADVAGINQLVSGFPGDSLSICHIKSDTEEEDSALSRLFVELKPVI